MATLYVAIDKAGGSEIPHWCLYTMDDENGERIYEALGSTGSSFRYHTKSDCIEMSEQLYRTIKIGRIEADVWPEVADLLARVPMSNARGWNCQNWVMQGIAALKKEGCLEEHEKGTDYIKSKYQKTFGRY